MHHARAEHAGAKPEKLNAGWRNHGRRTAAPPKNLSRDGKAARQPDVSSLKMPAPRKNEGASGLRHDESVSAAETCCPPGSGVSSLYTITDPP